MSILENPLFDLIINTDGGSRNNPGHSGIGAVLKDPSSGKTIHKLKKYIGITTNNCAEYIAVLESIRASRGLNAKKIKILSDSELLVKQMHGEYKIKDEKLKKLHFEIRNISKDFEMVVYEHISRKLNKEADFLVNQAIDEYLSLKS